jgi:phage-related protein
MAWKILFFQTPRGEKPVEKFIESQDEAIYARILHSLELLEKYGPFLKPPHAKKIKSDLYELRIVGKNSLRILYTSKSERYFLLHAFKKNPKRYR